MISKPNIWILKPQANGDEPKDLDHLAGSLKVEVNEWIKITKGDRTHWVLWKTLVSEYPDDKDDDRTETNEFIWPREVVLPVCVYFIRDRVSNEVVYYDAYYRPQGIDGKAIGVRTLSSNDLKEEGLTYAEAYKMMVDDMFTMIDVMQLTGNPYYSDETDYMRTPSREKVEFVKFKEHTFQIREHRSHSITSDSDRARKMSFGLEGSLVQVSWPELHYRPEFSEANSPITATFCVDREGKVGGFKTSVTEYKTPRLRKDGRKEYPNTQMVDYVDDEVAGQWSYEEALEEAKKRVAFRLETMRDMEMIF